MMARVVWLRSEKMDSKAKHKKCLYMIYKKLFLYIARIEAKVYMYTEFYKWTERVVVYLVVAAP